MQFLGIRRDVAALLSAADAFALTSVSEAASLTLLEAMATGLPVIVTNVGGNPEIVRAGIDGLLVPRGDSVACATAIAKLFTEPGLVAKLGASARTSVREKYRLEQTIAAYFGLYRKLSCHSHFTSNFAQAAAPMKPASEPSSAKTMRTPLAG